MWNDDRLDALSERIDQRFTEVDQRFDRFERTMENRFNQMDVRLDGVQRSITHVAVALYGTTVAGFVAIVGLILTQT